MLEVPISPLLCVFITNVFFPTFFSLPFCSFLGYLTISLCHLSSLSSTSLFIDVYFLTSFLFPFCIFFFVVLFFFSSCHLSPLSFTSCFSNGGFHFIVFFFVAFIFSFKPHVVTSCFFTSFCFYFLCFSSNLSKEWCFLHHHSIWFWVLLFLFLYVSSFWNKVVNVFFGEFILVSSQNPHALFFVRS